MSIKQLWAPWRMEFLEKGARKQECVFCALLAENSDRENLILYRGKKAFVLMNKYPYNNGHLMVIPNTHTNDLVALTAADGAEIHDLTQHSVRALGESYAPQGYNIGMNLGGAAGAGIKEHLHMHVIPRWVGDTNFLPVIGETKAMPHHLLESFDRLHGYFSRMK